jgi:hypothetical protein
MHDNGLWRKVSHVMNILNLKHYVIMLIHAFAIFIVYVVSKNSIYVMFYKYLSDSISSESFKLEKHKRKN